MNVLENEDSFEVQVFATGFDKDSIGISVVDDVLLIKGKKELKPEDEPRFHIQEFPVRHFERQLALNGKIAVNDISAQHEHGVLKIRLPKNPEARSHSIPVV